MLTHLNVLLGVIYIYTVSVYMYTLVDTAFASLAGTRHLKFQTVFEDNRNGLIEEHRHTFA